MGMKKKSDIAKDFGIPRNTLSTYLKNKEKILRSESECDKGRKRLREPGNPDLDKCVLKWFKQARDKKIPVSGHLIRSKAEQFATEMGTTDFKASSGWLDGFKERNKISFKTICGESGAVNLQVAEQWKNNLRELIQDKDARDVFNLPLLMIGKAANPRCFKNVKTKPVDYANSARAWMTSYLFEKWLLNSDKKFTKEKRKVILFIDNCTAHNSIPPMENVEVFFFPATSVIQPMDKGVIKNLKHFYRRFLVENILTGDSEALKIKLDVLQASRLCKKAWDQVTSETIKHCFKKAGFVKKEEDEENADVIIAETMPSVDGWEDVISNPTISYDDFLNVDDDVAVCGEITDADIIAEVLNHNIEKQDGDEASGDEDESSVAGEMNIPSAAEATNYIMQLRRFFESKNDGPVTASISKGRGGKVEKPYIWLFVWFVTKVIHMELVTDASTSTFIAIKEDRSPPAEWLVGRVETHPGKDGLVRVDSVQTAGGEIRNLNFQLEHGLEESAFSSGILESMVTRKHLYALNSMLAVANRVILRVQGFEHRLTTRKYYCLWGDCGIKQRGQLRKKQAGENRQSGESSSTGRILKKARSEKVWRIAAFDQKAEVALNLTRPGWWLVCTGLILWKWTSDRVCRSLAVCKSVLPRMDVYSEKWDASQE
ncbi:hypothetical protein LAZ67_X004383 [Cordylochernes scorpioides]|uniref:HTH CENPB-type domain-containing protein n=1 Tax=Cordylochernes scorpioides TaxID=51811 RepID=A0ABY6LZ06_9ARAC|nr:hypothetical protein LAZ67_X004383 [Cordylochernes scorpioides]